jgi:DNA polymerase III subunit gamma/tau
MRLDLKYRPRKFSEVLGNEGVVQLLLKRSHTGTLTEQSMLFGGPKGTGKTTLARIVAMAAVCVDKLDGEPCGNCGACTAVLNENSVAVEELDAASQGTVDKIRGMIHDSEYEVPGGIGNIYILDEAQRLTQAAQDAMLKAVEDRSIIMIMCTTEPHKIRDSIRSRVEEYPVSAPSIDVMVARLAQICELEKIKYDQSALRLIAQLSKNCPRICYRAVETISVSGPVDIQAARKFLRFDSYELVDKILARIDDQPKLAIEMFDSLVDREGAVWVRDAMILAVSSGLRVDVGAGPSYPISTTFFQTRLRRWSDFARQIGMIERPTGAGILSALISTSTTYLNSTYTPPVVTQISQTPVTKTLGAPSSVASVLDTTKTPTIANSVPEKIQVEVDGVNFSYGEKLTTLDTKIGTSSIIESKEPEPNIIEFKPDLIPMSDREFARDFIKRMGPRHAS